MAKCERCGKEGALRKRQRTAYVDDSKNFAVYCDECQKDADKYWDEMWDEYNRSRG